MNWFGKSRRPPGTADSTEERQINLDLLGRYLLGPLSELERATPDLPLLCARLADLHRDLEVEPMQPERFMDQANGLDVEAQRRLALTIHGLQEPSTRDAFARCSNDGAEARAQLLFAFAREHELLTLQVLLDSSLRREEFLRHLVARLGAGVMGETDQQSRDRLQRLDYKSLLAEAERAKASAAERMAYLKKLQEEQEKRLGRRGKI